jgi:hypothetical protein
MLAHRIDNLELNAYLFMGKGDIQKHLENEDSVKEDLFEAILGAIAIDTHWNQEILEDSVNYMLNMDHFLKYGFTEDDKPNFFGSAYSTVKGYTDELMHMFDNVLNVRIRMPIIGEDNQRNFITKIKNYKKICSIANSMTVLPELLPIMVDMAENNTTGTVNLTNPGLITHNENLEMYKEYVDENFPWENFTVEEQNAILAAGRSNNCLDTTRLQSLYPEVKHIKDSVRDLMKNYKKFI